MKLNVIKKILVFVLMFVILEIIQGYNDSFIDTIKYNKKNYVLLDYNMDIFTYYHNSNDYYEEDIIHPVEHNKWDIIYFNGDLFVLRKQIKEANKYYKDDKNYNWYVSFDCDEEDIKKSISISESELSYLYNMETVKRDITVTFDEINSFASILKISKDNLIQGIITLARINDTWYYKTEVMTDDDREYVIKITDSLNDKINDLINSI